MLHHRYNPDSFPVRPMLECSASLPHSSNTSQSQTDGQHPTVLHFLWLLLIPAVLLVFCLWESFTDSGRVTEKKGLVWFVVLTGIWQFGYELAMGIQNTGLFDDNTRLYYLMKSLFS